MKKIMVIVFALFITGTLNSCDNITTDNTTTDNTTTQVITFVDCQMGYMWDGDACIDDPQSIVVENKLYWEYYVGEDYTVFRATYRPEIVTDDEIEVGEYDGNIYYFGSGTYYAFYRVVKNDEIVLLNDAIAMNWFTLEVLVNDFNIEELLSYPSGTTSE
ncbi:MAG: hypothetical protein JXB08_06160 [Bacilli bacterium]|nr:hypothetical protein [Bacilli bacterium]MBN2877230.1 hypothetical protein [Bacilli bacterium]